MSTFYDLMKYAATGQASPDMTYYDKMRASALMGGATVQTLTGQPPLSFKADGTPLISWSMKGNGQQTGTPTPDNPIQPTFCGTLDGAVWTIPITCAGQTTTVNLGQTQTVRRVRKLVLTGEETNWVDVSTGNTKYFRLPLGAVGNRVPDLMKSTHFENADIRAATTAVGCAMLASSSQGYDFCAIRPENTATTSVSDFKSYLAAQYAAGTPVTVWYVLAEPATGIINEPLAKIGDYADELSSTDAAVTIPTAKGQNTLTVDTDLQPSEMTITYRG